MERFLLKDFFYAPEAGRAEYNLSRSFAEPLQIGELLAFEPDAQETMNALALGYTGLDGSLALREAISGRYRGFGADQVVATSGLDEAISLLSLSLLAPGERIIVQTPAYQTYLTVPRWRGADVVEWPARPERGWLPDLDELAALLQTPARWVMINFPNNPTGVMPDVGWFEGLLEIVSRSDALLISDEIYAGLPAREEGFLPLCCRYGKAISLHSVSKTLGLPGLRIGWIVCADGEVRAKIKDLRFHFNSFVPAPSEYLGAIALCHEDEILARNSSILAQNIETAGEFFDRHDNLFGWSPPQAGVNAWPEWRGPGTSGELSESMLRDAGLLIAHSALFQAGDRNMRLGLGCRGLEQALGRFDGFLERAFR